MAGDPWSGKLKFPGYFDVEISYGPIGLPTASDIVEQIFRVARR
jgi:hypothetical protein